MKLFLNKLFRDLITNIGIVNKWTNDGKASTRNFPKFRFLFW